MDIVYVLEENLQSFIMYKEDVWQVFLFETYYYFRGAFVFV